MPFLKYLIIKRAAEIDELESRLALISDINAAFSGNEDHVKLLQKILVSLKGYEEQKEVKIDKDWEDRLRKYQR